MGAQERILSLLDVYRAGRELGHGKIPGNMTDEQIRSRYNLIIQTLQNTFKGTREEYLRFVTHITYVFNFLEFESAWKVLQRSHTLDEFVRLSRKEIFRLFQQYAQQHPDQLFEANLREHCIDTLVKTGIMKKEWYAHPQP